MQANIRIPDGPELADPETPPTETGGGKPKGDGSRTSGAPKPKEER